MKISQLQNLLDSSIMSVKDSLSQFTYDPGHSFLRNRKLPFEKVVSTILAMEGRTLNSELLYQSGCSPDTASASAFFQQRSKLKYTAFEKLFHEFTASAIKHSNSKKDARLYKGYRLFAVDGSDIRIPADPTDTDSFIQAQDNRPYGLIHLNAMYDLLSHIYVDATIQKFRNMNERRALADMVDRTDIPQPAIIIADRGYEAYNVLAHIQEKGWKFLIRVKDLKSGGRSSGILHGFNLPDDDEFDVDMNLNLTYRLTNDVKVLLKDRNHYKLLKNNREFDYLPPRNKKDDPVMMYYLKFRIVRFRLPSGTYEAILTNLDKNDFSVQEIRNLYAKRWGIETSFRYLKYTVGLLYFHSKKAELIFQEIYSRLTMYNFFEFIVSQAVIPKKGRKHDYVVNFSAAAHICREFFLKKVPPPDVEALISRYLIPIRPDRSSPRKMSPRTSVSFIYRVA